MLWHVSCSWPPQLSTSCSSLVDLPYRALGTPQGKWTCTQCFRSLSPAALEVPHRTAPAGRKGSSARGITASSRVDDGSWQLMDDAKGTGHACSECACAGRLLQAAQGSGWMAAQQRRAHSLGFGRRQRSRVAPRSHGTPRCRCLPFLPTRTRTTTKPVRRGRHTKLE